MDNIGKASASAIYPSLRKMAHFRLRTGRDTLLDTTALVHESFIRFAESGAGADNWPVLLRYAPRIMHNVVVDSIRHRCAEVHGGCAADVDLENALSSVDAESTETAAVRHALERLKQVDARLARVVELRFFDGLTESEIAAALGIAERTVRRDWDKARLLLAQILGS